MNRRQFISVVTAAGLLAACDQLRGKKKIGLALGGGGAKGIAHIPMLEVFDQYGIVPHRLAGTSIGAVIGSLYASGMSGADVRKVLDALTKSKDEDWLYSLRNEEVSRWFEFLDLRLGRGGLINPDKIGAFLGKRLKVSSFEKLKIPLQVVAADLWSRKQVVFESGDLVTAVTASMAIPGLFEPVKYQGKVLVDGSVVNPLPYDLLFDDCDVVVAIDVLGERTPDSKSSPGYFETSFNTLQIMENAIVTEKLKHKPPDIYIKPKLRDIRVLDFYKVDKIFHQAESSRRELAEKLKPYRVKT